MGGATSNLSLNKKDTKTRGVEHGYWTERRDKKGKEGCEECGRWVQEGVCFAINHLCKCTSGVVCLLEGPEKGCYGKKVWGCLC